MARTGEIARIVDELRRAYDGECWHGPPLLEVLKGVTARTAAATHPPLVHSIWALVNHVSAWIEVVTRRVSEWRPIPAPERGDFPPVTEVSESAWKTTLEELDGRHRRLLQLAADLEPAKLDDRVPGKDYPVAVMLHGTAQHYGYHAGQIAVLKKLVGEVGEPNG